MKRFFTSILFLLSLQCSATRWYVNASVSGANSGISWTDAFVDLQTALGNSTFGDEIWVAAGTYKPTTTTSTSISFLLVNGVSLYGGFNGSESLLSERNFLTNISILSGNIGNGGSTTDNSIHVVGGDNVGSQTRLDGFRISDGHSSSLAGGVYLSSSSPTISNCTFINNFALDAAGALTHNGGTLTLTNCTFLSNFTDGIGGALQIRSGTARITDCKFTSNLAGSTGGAMYLSGGVSYIDRCIFDGNTAQTNSGAIYHLYDNSMILSNSLFIGNYAPRISIMYIPPSSNGQAHSIINCTFAHNRQTQNTGIEYPIVVNSLTEIANSIFWDNGGVASMYPNANAHDCLIQGGFTSGTANISSNPTFVNPGLTVLAPFTLDGLDYHVLATSPVIDLGVNAEIVAPADHDLDNATRIFGPRCDLGAYELAYCNLPVSIISESPIPFCPQTTHTLSASSGDNFSWSKGTSALGTSNSIDVSTPGIYNVSASSAEGCRGTASLTVTYSTITFLITGNLTFCAGESTTLSLSGDFQNPVWNNSINNAQLVVTSSGTQSVTAQTTEGCEITLTANVASQPLPNPNITLVGNHLNAGTGFSSYQWYLNGNPISGANQYNYTPTENGDYTVKVTNSSGCEKTSNPFSFNSLGIEIENSESIKIYPQPSTNILYIDGIPENANIRCLDIIGKVIFVNKISQGKTQCFDLSSLDSGLYVIQIVHSGRLIYSNKILKN